MGTNSSTGFASIFPLADVRDVGRGGAAGWREGGGWPAVRGHAGMVGCQFGIARRPEFFRRADAYLEASFGPTGMVRIFLGTPQFRLPEREKASLQARSAGEIAGLAQRRGVRAGSPADAAELLDVAAHCPGRAVSSGAPRPSPVEEISAADAGWHSSRIGTRPAFGPAFRHGPQWEEEPQRPRPGTSGDAGTGSRPHSVALRADALERTRANDRAPPAGGPSAKRFGADGSRVLELRVVLAGGPSRLFLRDPLAAKNPSQDHGKIGGRRPSGHVAADQEIEPQGNHALDRIAAGNEAACRGVQDSGLSCFGGGDQCARPGCYFPPRMDSPGDSRPGRARDRWRTLPSPMGNRNALSRAESGAGSGRTFARPHA